jgi:hypothetical protein
MIKLKDVESKRLLLIVLMILGIFTLASCATTSCQKYSQGGGMIAIKGSVVGVAADKGVYLCVGSLDGASVGQELEVWRTSYGRGSAAGTAISAGSVSSGEISERMVGKVRIKKVLDEHYSLAEVISGDARLNDIVEAKY